MSAQENDLRKVEEALIMLSGHLPLFTTNSQKKLRAERHLALRDEAFDALDRLSDFVSVPRGSRRLA